MRVILLSIGILALFVLAACGSNDNDTRPAGDVAPTQVLAPTATPQPEPPAAPMTPATAPEPGSDDEQIMAVLEKQIRAVNTADYVAFQETCTPSAQKLPTLDQLKYTYEVRQGATGGTQDEINFSPQGYNVRNVAVKLLRAPYAQASIDIYDYDEYVTGRPVFRTFEKVDGKWYSESAPCKQG